MNENKIRKDERMKMGAILCSYLHYSQNKNEEDARDFKGSARQILIGRAFEDIMILDALEELRATGSIKINTGDTNG